MIRWKKKRCQLCKKKMKTDEESFHLEMKTLDGIVKSEVCNDCGKFFNALTDVIEREYEEDE